jgi:hypothetical protein
MINRKTGKAHGTNVRKHVSDFFRFSRNETSISRNNVANAREAVPFPREKGLVS